LFVVQLLKASSQASAGKTEEEKTEGKEKAAAAIVTLEGGLSECSKGKPFFGGESAGYVDVILGGLLGWVRVIDGMQGVKTFDPSSTPLLAAWAERFGKLEQVEAVMPDVKRLTEYAYAKAMEAAAAAGATN
jgi:glutathione S-transferase